MSGDEAGSSSSSFIGEHNSHVQTSVPDVTRRDTHTHTHISCAHRNSEANEVGRQLLTAQMRRGRRTRMHPGRAAASELIGDEGWTSQALPGCGQAGRLDTETPVTLNS